MDDYPNNGEAFDPTAQPEERDIAERKEETNARVAMPLIEEAIERLDKEIARHEKVSEFGITEDTPKDEIKAILLAHQYASQYLESERAVFDTLQRQFS